MSIEVHADAEIVTVPLLLAGFGIGALASLLGSVTVSAVPDDQSPEVGGLQNTATNLGASIRAARIRQDPAIRTSPGRRGSSAA